MSFLEFFSEFVLQLFSISKLIFSSKDHPSSSKFSMLFLLFPYFFLAPFLLGFLGSITICRCSQHSGWVFILLWVLWQKSIILVNVTHWPPPTTGSWRSLFFQFRDISLDLQSLSPYHCVSWFYSGWLNVSIDKFSVFMKKFHLQALHKRRIAMAKAQGNLIGAVEATNKYLETYVLRLYAVQCPFLVLLCLVVSCMFSWAWQPVDLLGRSHSAVISVLRDMINIDEELLLQSISSSVSISLMLCRFMADHDAWRELADMYILLQM